MPGNYRYEEERTGGPHTTSRHSGVGERGRDDDLEQRDRERHGGPEYGREAGPGRSQGDYEESWRRPGDAGRSLGGRGAYEGYEDEGERFGRQDAGGREGNRYGRQYGQGERSQGGFRGQQYGQSMRDFNPSQGFAWSPESGQSLQGHGGRQQGLYGSTEFGGYSSSPRSQKDYQSHVGKGPKGWQRSDERIREEVSEALARHPEIDASEIEVTVTGGEVTLSGTVPDRQAKRMAEDLVEDVLGVKDVECRIRVKPNTSAFGERDVTRSADRDTRTGTEGQEPTSRKAGTSTSGSTTR